MKVAFVVQRYGPEVNGGAEFLCRTIAEHLSKIICIDIITTCAIDYVTWKNEYPQGTSVSNNVTIHRFPVDFPRDNQKFNQFSDKIFHHSHSIDDEILWMKLQGPYSSTLFHYIQEKKNDYDLFVFFTYLYCTTFFGLPLVSNKAILVPTAHDEPPIYLSIFNSLFYLPKALIFSTIEEKEFVNSKFNTIHIPQEIIGTGISVPNKLNPIEFEQKFGLKNFILYIGRIDESKGCRELFDFFIRYKLENPSSLKLLLMGKNVMELPSHPDIIALGFVSEKDKFNGLKASELLIMPSLYESLSIVLFEAWFCERPVLVNGNCQVLKGQCLRSNGGLYYQNYEEFKVCLNLILQDDFMKNKLGIQGKRYLSEYFSWDVVEKKYINFFKKILKNSQNTNLCSFRGRRLTSIPEIDNALNIAADARKISEHDFLEELRSFWFDFTPIEGDPWSPEYKNYWWNMYEKLSGKAYKVQNELFDFNVDYHIIHPYPFCTQDYRIVSQQLIAIGHLIEKLALPSGSSVLELGAGWGNTSLFLAQMGYIVTVLDINPKYGELINKRGKSLNVDIDFLCCSFDEVVKLNKKFDCVLFYESFHHSYDHLKLLDEIPSLLTKEGILALAGEPILKDLPFEWGLNPAGEALWQMRKNGWFEVIFRESYLISTLERKGFSVKTYPCLHNPGEIILISQLRL